MCVYIYIYISVYNICIYMYIHAYIYTILHVVYIHTLYIYIERERER